MNKSKRSGGVGSPRNHGSLSTPRGLQPPPTTRRPQPDPKSRSPTLLDTRVSNLKSVKKEGSDISRGSNKVALPHIKSVREKFDEMISGDLTDLLPKPPAEVCIFLSSTFSDMRAERNWLAREAYPKLKDYCYNNLDIDFQVVDLRWGITDDSRNEHLGKLLCLRELERCQRVSLGPNFVLILGDRSGTRSLPREIAKEEFETLLRVVSAHSTGALDALNVWYHKDENACPPTYTLQRINSVLEHFSDKATGSEAMRRAAGREWEQVSRQMRRALLQAVEEAVSKGALPEAAKFKYTAAVTEFEIEQGIVAAQHPGTTALCLVRRLRGLDDRTLGDEHAKRCIDTVTVNGREMVDQNAITHQKQYLDDKISRVLARQQISRYDVMWRPGGVNPEKHPDHKEYLKRLAGDFTINVMRMIEEAKHEREQLIPSSEYYTQPAELLHHLHFCRSKYALFRGQTGILKQLRAALSDSKIRQPLVIHAESGVGKTSVVAMVMKMLPTWFGPDCTRVVRFLGTTPDNSSIYSVLLSVIGQLADEFDMLLEPVGTKNMRAITNYLPRFLRSVSRATKEHVFILLDSLDQLTPSDGAHTMRWLPVETAANVHLILSTLPTTHSIFSNTTKLIGSETAFQLNPIPEDTGREIIDTYLSSKNRCVTDAQRALLVKNLMAAPTPLFLKLLLDQAVTWQSQQPVSAIRLATSVREAINHLFTDLEVKFGRTLVARALGYMTVGLNGLSEIEVEDVLSCDDEVLDEVYQFHNPPVEGIVRIPTLVWKRIRYDINEYVVDRQSQGKKTMFWYHRQFTEAAHSRYVKDKQRRLLHRNLAQLYLADTGVHRTVTLSRRNITVQGADRQVTPQPLVARNVRKLAALPYHLRGTGDPALARDAALCNLNFMVTKVTACGVSGLIKDYTAQLEVGGNESGSPGGGSASGAAERGPAGDREVELVRGCLEDMRGSLRSPGLLPVELLARLPAGDPALRSVTSLSQQCQESVHLSASPTLLPLYPCLADTDPLLYTAPGCLRVTSANDDITKVVVERAVKSRPEVPDRMRYHLVGVTAATETALPPDRMWHPPVLSNSGKHLYYLKSSQSPGGGAAVASARSDVSLPSHSKSKSSPGSRQGRDVMCRKYHTDRHELVEDHLLSFNDVVTSVQAFAVSEDGRSFACAFNKHRVCVFDQAKAEGGAAGNQLIKYSRSVGMELSKTDAQHLNIHKIYLPPGNEKCVSVATFSSGGGGAEQSPTTGTLLHSYDRKARTSRVLELPGSLRPESCTLLSDNQTLAMAVTLQQGGTDVLHVDYTAGEVIRKLNFPDALKNDVPLHVGVLVCVPVRGELVTHSLASGKKESAIAFNSAAISCLTIDDASERLCVGDNMGKVHLWQVEGGRYSGHVDVYKNDAVAEVSFTRDADTLVTMSERGTISVWSMKQLLQQARGRRANQREDANLTLPRHATAVAISVPPDGSRVATLDLDGHVRIWDIKTFNVTDTLRVTKEGVVATEDTMEYICKGAVVIIFLRGAGTLKMVNIETKKEVPLEGDGYHSNVAAYVKHKDDRTLTCLVQEKTNVYSGYVLDAQTASLKHTFAIKGTLIADEIDVKLTSSEQFLVLKMKVQARELEILVAAEKKNNLFKAEGMYKFGAIDLSNNKPTQELRLCYRQLTNVPCLGQSWEVESDSDGVIIGRGRLCLMWDVRSGSCVIRMVKGTKIQCYFRPEWIEDDKGPMVCHGATNSIQRSPRGDLTVIGSSDGWVMFYDHKGSSLPGYLNKKPNHGGVVDRVCVSANSKWAASVSANQTLRLWCVPDKCAEVFSVQLDVAVRDMCFTPDSRHFVIHGAKPTAKTKVLLFQVVTGKIF